MPRDDSHSRSRQIDSAIAEYLEALDRGAPLDRESYLAKHADIADELREFLTDYSALKQAAPPPASGSGSGSEPTTDLNRRKAHAATNGAALDVLRYFGDYELLEEIARGGMGVVYKARQLTLGRTVAVKMILAGQLASQDEVDRFYAEAQAAATLDHPNIVPIFEVGQHQGQHYFSMGYVAGQSLAQRLSTGPLPPREAASIIRDVARAVHYAHGKEVIHRDLKPANILFDADGHPRVTDFGLAKRRTEESGLTVTGQVLGTPSYMPPEQISGSIGQVGPAADVYSLGATLYALVAGRPPFQAASAMDTLKQVLEKEPVPPREFDPSVPRDLETITLKCLEKSPARRYASAEVLAQELDRYLSGRPILARPVSRVEHAWRWCRRNPVVAGLSALAAGLLLAVAIVSTLAYYRESDLRGKVETESRGRGAALVSEKNARQAEATALGEARRQQNLAEESAKLATRRQHEAEESDKSVRRHLYVANMNLAQTAWEENHMDALRALLKRAAPKPGEEDLRGFEWYYWNRLCHRDLMSLSEGANVTGIAYSPDGTRLAAASWDWMIRIWNVGAGDHLMTLKGHTGSVYCVVFSPDGKRMASSGGDQLVKLWDSNTGQELMTLKGHTGVVHAVAFSPDGLRLASASADKTIRLWDVSTGQETHTLKGHGNSVECVAFSPNGKQLASGSGDKTVKLWDVTTGEETSTLQGHSNYVESVAFNPDGRQLASASRDRTIKLWDLTTGQVIVALNGHHAGVASIAFSPDGKTLLSGSDDTTVKLWNTTDGKEICTLKGHGSDVSSVAFSPDGKTVASAASEVKIWDAAITPEINTLFKSDGSVTCVAFSPDGTRIAAADVGATTKIWDATANRISTLIGGASSLAFSPVGSFLASANSPYIKISNVATSREISSWTDGEQLITALAYSPDGACVASASFDQTVKLWDVATGRKLLTLSGHTRGVDAVAFSPDGRRLASGSADATIKLWDVATGNELFTLSQHPTVGCLAFSPNGTLLAAAGDEPGIVLWDLATRQETARFSGHSNTIKSLAFSPDGLRLASASTDQTVKLWDVPTGQETLTLRGHDGWVRSVAFSPDGHRLISGGDDMTVKLWDTLNTTQRNQFEQSLAFAMRMAAEHPHDPKYRQTLGNRHTAYGIWLDDELDRAAAKAHYDLALSIRKELVDDFPDDPDYLVDLGGINCNIGIVITAEDAAAALVWFDRAQLALDSAASKNPSALNAKRYLANTRHARSVALKRLGRTEDAAAEGQAATKLRQEIEQSQTPGETSTSRNISESSKKLEQVVVKATRDLQSAAAILEYTRLATAYPGIPEYRRTLAERHNALGIQLSRDGDRAGAREHYDKALTLFTKLVEESSERLPDCLTFLGGVCCNMGLLDIDDDAEEALKWFDRAQEAIERTIAKTPKDVLAITFLRNTHHGRASALVKLGRNDEGAEYRQKAAELQTELKQLEQSRPTDAK